MQIKPSMAKKLNYIAIAIAALLVLTVSVVLWYFPKEYADNINHPQGLDPVEPGIWDLRQFDLDAYNIFVRGETEYVMGELFTPEEFEHYEGEILLGWPPEGANQVVTVRLMLYMPEDKVYSMVSTSAEYNERVYINGEWRHDVGTPGLTAKESVAAHGYKRLDAVPVDGVIEIVRQSSNFVHKEGGGYTGYYVGSPDNIARMMDIEKLFAAISIGLFLCLFLLHSILYLVVRGYRPNLWFALICLFWMIRAGFTGRAIYWAMFPNIPWELLYRLGCASIAFTGIFLLLLVRDQFPHTVQKWPLRIFNILQAGFIIFYIFADTTTISSIKVGSEILLYIAAIYLAVRFIMVLPKQIRKKQLYPEQIITLIGLGVALFALLHDAVRYNNWLPGFLYYEIGEAGMLVLVLFQMAAMVLGTLRQLTEARQDVKIALENVELSRKNEQLAMLRAENAEKDAELLEQLIAEIPQESLVICGPFTLNMAGSQAFFKDKDLLLTPRDFALFHRFTQHEGKTVSRERLHEEAWGAPLAPKDRALDSSIYRLRKKLEGSGYAIYAVRGEGFRFESEEE